MTRESKKSETERSELFFCFFQKGNCSGRSSLRVFFFSFFGRPFFTRFERPTLRQWKSTEESEGISRQETQSSSSFSWSSSLILLRFWWANKFQLLDFSAFYESKIGWQNYTIRLHDGAQQTGAVELNKNGRTDLAPVHELGRRSVRLLSPEKNWFFTFAFTKYFRICKYKNQS